MDVAKELISVADLLDKAGHAKLANKVDRVLFELAKEGKAKVRSRPNPVFQSTHPKVKDNKDHFPLGDADQARNALARANQYSSAPDWWDGSLQELVNAVVRSVKKDFPSIEVSEKSKELGKG